MTITPSPLNAQRQPRWGSMTEFWILADMLLDLELCNRLSDIMLEKWAMTRLYIDPDAVNDTWGRLAPDSPLKKPHVDIFLQWQLSDALEELEAMLSEFLLELSRRFIIEEGKPHLTEGAEVLHGVKCRYHRHHGGEKCGL